MLGAFGPSLSVGFSITLRSTLVTLLTTGGFGVSFNFGSTGVTNTSGFFGSGIWVGFTGSCFNTGLLGSLTPGPSLGTTFGVGFCGSSGSLGSEGNGLVVPGVTLPFTGFSGKGVGVGGVGRGSLSASVGATGSFSNVGLVGSVPFSTALYLITILTGVTSRRPGDATSPRTTGTSIVCTCSPVGRTLVYAPSSRYGNFGLAGSTIPSYRTVL